MSCEWKVALAWAIRQRGETLIFPCPSQAQETPFLEESGTLAVFLHQLNTSARALSWKRAYVLWPAMRCSTGIASNLFAVYLLLGAGPSHRRLYGNLLA